MANTTKTGRRGRPPLSAAEKKRRAELKTQAPKQQRRARSKNQDTLVGLPQSGWWQTLAANQDYAIICNPVSNEFRHIHLPSGKMKRIMMQEVTPQVAAETISNGTTAYAPDSAQHSETSQPVFNEGDSGDEVALEIPETLRRNEKAA